jgi:hypothetical protein
MGRRRKLVGRGNAKENWLTAAEEGAKQSQKQSATGQLWSSKQTDLLLEGRTAVVAA